MYQEIRYRNFTFKQNIIYPLNAHGNRNEKRFFIKWLLKRKSSPLE